MLFFRENTIFHLNNVPSENHIKYQAIFSLKNKNQLLSSVDVFGT